MFPIRTAPLARATALTALLGSLALLSAAPATASSGAPSGGSIVGTWTTRTDGVGQDVTFTRDGRVSGDAGCNRMMGTYTVDGSALDISTIATTLMYCEGVMEAERTFLKALEKSTAFSRDGKRLTLIAASGRETLTLRRR